MYWQLNMKPWKTIPLTHIQSSCENARMFMYAQTFFRNSRTTTITDTCPNKNKTPMSKILVWPISGFIFGLVPQHIATISVYAYACSLRRRRRKPFRTPTRNIRIYYIGSAILWNWDETCWRKIRFRYPYRITNASFLYHLRNLQRAYTIVCSLRSGVGFSISFL